MRKANFRVGQVVRHRIAGGFFMRIIKAPALGDENKVWITMEQGKITSYFEWQLRHLTAREIGPRPASKGGRRK
jgi:hypothetical protein